MSVRMVRVLNEWDDEFDRVGDEPGGQTILELEAARETLYGIGVAATHVDTGALVESLSSDSSRAGANWEMEMQWGNADYSTPGMVDYAYFEQRRDSDHDFTLPVKASDDIIGAAIERGLAG